MIRFDPKHADWALIDNPIRFPKVGLEFLEARYKCIKNDDK